MEGKVILVGAGPGDMGLLTGKGLLAIRTADVIVYDHLANESILNETKPECRWIYAGKTAGHHAMKQEKINELLVALAKENQIVVRLKGGDPYIFGRGAEEVMALQKAGIAYDVIPGVSSFYAAPAYAGIPVTHRGLASSVHVITGHEDPEKPHSSLDYSVIAQEEGTLIFLMGLSKVDKISERLIDCGKDPDTPAAVIASGTRARQQVVLGTLKTIADKVIEEQVKPPAVFLVGEVVSIAPEIEKTYRKPLAGKRILVTATKQIADRMAGMIEACGGEPVLMSLIDVKPSAGLLVAPYFKNQDRKWIAFTSRNGVDIFFKQFKNEQLDMRCLANCRFAVIGSGTGEALENHGFYADLVPKEALSSSLGEALADAFRAEGKEHFGQVLLFRAQEGSAELSRKLSECGIDYKEIPLYETMIMTHKKDLLTDILWDIDAVTFCSASAVKAYAYMAGNIKTDAKMVYIGPVAAAQGRNCHLAVDAVADQYNLDGLMKRLKGMLSDMEE